MLSAVRLSFGALALLGAMSLDASEAPSRLDVSIAVFDSGVPEDRDMQRELGIFPRIRGIEARLLPYALREALEATRGWGAVRVVPDAELVAELLIEGTILRSDGESLAVRVSARDASGRTWFDEVIESRDYAGTGDGGGDHAPPVHRALGAAVAERLHTARGEIDDDTVARIREIALLRYGLKLAPSAFSRYLESAGNGSWQIVSLPAEGDPMLARIERIRSTEYVIVDAVDEKFALLYSEIASVYDLWRDYRRKSLEYRAADDERALARDSGAPRGSYEALQRQYDNYKWSRITAQELDALAVAFDNEVGPLVARVETRVAELEGWVDAKYVEWNRLLEELFDVETRPES